MEPRKVDHRIDTDFPIEIHAELKLDSDDITINVERNSDSWLIRIVLALLIAAIFLGASTSGFMQRVDCGLGVQPACEKIAASYRTP